MTKNKKIFLWLMGGAGALLVVLLVLLLILPKIINIAPVKEKILANVSRTVGGDVACQQLNLSFLPRPHVEIYQGTLTIPEKITGHVGSLKVYLKIWPLFKGQFQFTSIRVEAPDFKIGLPEKPEIGKDPQEQIPFEVMIQEKVTPLLAQLLSQAPDLVVTIEEGRLSLTENQQSEFSFDQLQARIALSPSSIGIDLACRSNVFETLTVKGNLGPEDYRGKGQVHLARFRPHLVMNTLISHAGRRVGDSPVDLDLNFETSGLTRFQAEVTGSVPHLALHQADQKVVIKGVNLKGDFLRDGDKTSVVLRQLNLEYPRLQVTGKFEMAELSPRISLELEGREVDVYSARETALALAGTDRVVQMIFDILRGGETPWIIFKTHGDSVKDLGKLDNLFIQGRLNKGKIGTALFLPGVDADLEDAGGDITISKGMLEGENLEARLGN
ncbi:AsmA family protein, partial [bacterium]|nr:AsmA family protein [bacterium]